MQSLRTWTIASQAGSATAGELRPRVVAATAATVKRRQP